MFKLKKTISKGFRNVQEDNRKGGNTALPVLMVLRETGKLFVTVCIHAPDSQARLLLHIVPKTSMRKANRC